VGRATRREDLFDGTSPGDQLLVRPEQVGRWQAGVRTRPRGTLDALALPRTSVRPRRSRTWRSGGGIERRAPDGMAARVATTIWRAAPITRATPMGASDCVSHWPMLRAMLAPRVRCARVPIGERALGRSAIRRATSAGRHRRPPWRPRRIPWAWRTPRTPHRVATIAWKPASGTLRDRPVSAGATPGPTRSVRGSARSRRVSGRAARPRAGCPGPSGLPGRLAWMFAAAHRALAGRRTPLIVATPRTISHDEPRRSGASVGHRGCPRP